MNKIINELNSTLKELRAIKGIDNTSHFVLKKNVLVESFAKVYKTVIVELYIVNGANHKIVISTKDTVNSSKNSDIWNGVERDFIKKVLFFVRSKHFDEIIEGTYEII